MARNDGFKRNHALSGKRSGQWAIAVNDQWRICFCFEGEDAFDVETQLRDSITRGK